jgi:hypothetical protein
MRPEPLLDAAVLTAASSWGVPAKVVAEILAAVVERLDLFVDFCDSDCGSAVAGYKLKTVYTS